jgi:signal transduction histidine kinase
MTGARRPRLFRRIYLHGLVLLVLVALALGLAALLLGREAPFRVSPARIAAHLARELAATPAEALGSEVPRLGRELGVELAVFADDGRRLAATGGLGFLPLGPGDLARLRDAGVLRQRHMVVAAAAGPGRYVRLSVHPAHADVVRRALGGMLIVLGVLALASLPLARAIARPIERLGEHARRLGQGDLGARSGLSGSDEIGELARALDEMADRLQRLVEGQRELLASVSHELRTPLARLRVTLGLAAESEPGDAARRLRECETDLAELERLVGDVLSAARLDATGGFGLRREAVDCGELLERAAGRFRRLHPQRPLAVTGAAAPRRLQADPALVGRVLDNLLDNAAKYSDASTPIELSLSDAEGGVAIGVRDRGIGIAPEDLGRVFTPFFRGDRSRARDTGGAGLGLALAKRIVEAHGGRITLESRPGEGTRVSVWLPS